MLAVSFSQVSLVEVSLQIGRAYWVTLASSDDEKQGDLLVPLPIQHRMESLSQVPVFFEVFKGLFREHIRSRPSLFGILSRASSYQVSVI